jgi:hypothetical protein
MISIVGEGNMNTTTTRLCLTVICLASLTGCSMPFQREVFTDRSAVLGVIASDPELQSMWDEYAIDTNQCSILEMKAAKAMMQSAARFYVKTVPSPARLVVIREKWSQLSTSRGGVRDDFLDVEAIGTKYTFRESAYDGPMSWAVIEEEPGNAIHYYALAGDG